MILARQAEPEIQIKILGNPESFVEAAMDLKGGPPNGEGRHCMYEVPECHRAANVSHIRAGRPTDYLPRHRGGSSAETCVAT